VKLSTINRALRRVGLRLVVQRERLPDAGPLDVPETHVLLVRADAWKSYRVVDRVAEPWTGAYDAIAASAEIARIRHDTGIKR
jgi:hypothetical protein